jgi:hypothetical protein
VQEWGVERRNADGRVRPLIAIQKTQPTTNTLFCECFPPPCLSRACRGKMVISLVLPNGSRRYMRFLTWLPRFMPRVTFRFLLGWSASFSFSTPFANTYIR